MIKNLVATRFRARNGQERIFRMVSPERAAVQPKAEVAATFPEQTPRGENLLTGFEEMLSAYVGLVLRDLRD